MNQPTSAGAERVLVVTATAPNVAQASHASSISGQLSAWIRTLSPTSIPRSRKPGREVVRGRDELRVGPASRPAPSTGSQISAGWSGFCVGPVLQQPGDVLAVHLQFVDRRTVHICCPLRCGFRREAISRPWAGRGPRRMIAAWFARRPQCARLEVRRPRPRRGWSRPSAAGTHAKLGIDLDAGGTAVDEWFCAATLFGTRISASVATRTYRVLADAGVRTVVDAGERSWDDLVALLDAGGYVRYDFRTATRLQQLSAEVGARCGGSVASLATITDPRARGGARCLPRLGPDDGARLLPRAA